jgi:uncharacterized membrane protein (UPF0127 family)
MALHIHLYQKISGIFLLLAMSLCYADSSPQLKVEVATTHAQQEWGLMRRFSLDENHGMLFIYPHSQKMNFWMFNTFIDLSIAFIDNKKVVREIYYMKAFPEKMDPNRPVLTLADMDKYSDYGPEKTFFRQHSTRSTGQCPYALEVNAGWFEAHGVKIGDHMIFDGNQNELSFSRNK